MTVLKADKSGIKTIFDQNFGVSKIEKNQKSDLLYYGQASWSQGINQIDSLGITISIGTYSPKLVYNLNKDFAMDSILTRNYNEAEYVFAGYEASDILVAHRWYKKNSKGDKIRPYIFKK